MSTTLRRSPRIAAKQYQKDLLEKLKKYEEPEEDEAIVDEDSESELEIKKKPKKSTKSKSSRSKGVKKVPKDDSMEAVTVADDTGPEVIIKSDEAVVIYYDKFLTKEESRELFDAIMSSVEWRDEVVKVPFANKTTKAKRLTYSYGDVGTSYRYAGKNENPTTKWLKELLPIKERIEKITNSTYNFALLNYYRDGNDCIGAHSDSESGIVPESTIASLSIGIERDFVLQHKKEKSDRRVVCLGNGSLLTMGGKCQEFYKHEVPKRKRVTKGRINITFRKLKTDN